MGIQAWAFGQTSDPIEAMKLMESLSQDPMAARKALMEIYGGDELMVAMALHQMGLSAEQSDVLAKGGELGKGQPGTSFGTAKSSDLELSRFQATNERRLVEKARGMGDNTVFMEMMFKVQEKLLDKSSDSTKFTKQILDLMTEWMG